MNAAIRAVVRMCFQHKIEVWGILGGYTGFLNKDFQKLQPRDMANIIQRGGTVLKTGRSQDFHRPEVRAQAAQNLSANGIDALVCIGGDGSFRGAHALWLEHKIPIVGVPGTIDNDIFGTDHTIGFDTAVNTALDAIDRIRDTAASHDRLFIVEVMGRESGFIAAQVGLAGGAEEVFTPEYPLAIDRVLEKIRASQAKGKRSSILITAEGQKPGRAYDLADQIRKKSGLDAKVCILGHTQRGGSPTASDRVLATRLGAAAVQLLMEFTCDVMLGTRGEQIVTTDLSVATGQKKTLNREYVSLAQALSN